MLEIPGVNTQRDRRVTLFNAVQSLARDPSSLGDRLGENARRSRAFLRFFQGLRAVERAAVALPVFV